MSSPAPTEPPPLVQPASQLAARPVSWLWPGRLALGKLAVLDGDPGLGKSLITLDLCARLSTGRPFPDGSPGPGPASAIVLNGEDGAEDTIRPRLEALGADLDRVFVWHRTDGIVTEPLGLPAHLDRLDRALARTRAALLVLDPVVAFLDQSILIGNDQSVRRALLPLAQLAERHRCAVKLVRHINKQRGSRALYRGGGSIGFLAACRSGWLVGRDPKEPDRCVLAQVKNNLAPPQPSLAYRVGPAGDGPPTPSWLGPSPWGADQLLAGAERGPALFSPRERARDFLAAFLAEGPRTSREIWDAAQEQGLAERTLHRAREELGARAVRTWDGSKPVSYWALRGQELPATAPPASPAADLEPWLGPLRKQFPPPNPLDDG